MIILYNIMDILEEYKKEIVEDVKIDQLNILEKQMLLPVIKHKWVARLVDAKKNVNKLNKRKKILKKEAIEHLEKNLPKSLPKTAIDSKVEASEKIQELNETIEDFELLVLYLEKIEKLISEMYYGIKNSVDLIKMETT